MIVACPLIQEKYLTARGEMCTGSLPCGSLPRLAGVLGGFSRGSPTDWPVSYELK